MDDAVEARLRLALGARTGAETTYQTLNRVESLYNELTDQDLSTQLTAFFGSLSNLQTDPADTAARNLVLSNADTVIQTLQRQRAGMVEPGQRPERHGRVGRRKRRTTLASEDRQAERDDRDGRSAGARAVPAPARPARQPCCGSWAS